jgi:hypothetical protein
MHNSHSSPAGIQMNKTQVMAGASLLGAGSLIGMAGAIIGGHALTIATLRWLRDLEVPPTEAVRHKWSQTKAATTAGAQAWHSSNGMHAHSGRA